MPFMEVLVVSVISLAILSVIFNEKPRKWNPSGLVENRIQEYTSEKHIDTV
jgi:hypothetical protein